MVAAGCLWLVYTRLSGAARAEGLGVPDYLGRALDGVDWPTWVALMVPYSVAYLLLDGLVVWRVLRWFAAPIGYREVVRVRAGAYVPALVGEPVGKAAIAGYVARRHQVPARVVVSCMAFLMLAEYACLLGWAGIAVIAGGERLPVLLELIPWLAAGSAGALLLAHLWVTGRLGRPGGPRDRPLLTAFARARGWQYATVVALRSVLLVAAVAVYTVAAGLFGLDVTMPRMLGLLPVVLFGAAVPGPMRAVAVTLWVTLFPDQPAQAAAFGFAQHNLFVVVNAALGLPFLRGLTVQLTPAPRRQPPAPRPPTAPSS